LGYTHAVVTPYFLFLLTCWLTRDKIVEGLLLCEHALTLICIGVIILSCGVGGQLSPGHRNDFEKFKVALLSRCHFVALPVVQSLILAGMLAFGYMCHSHPGEADGVLQIVLCLVIALQIGLLQLAFRTTESVLDYPLALRQVFRLRRAPRIAVPSRTLGVLTPPPQLLPVA
jgi:hypothetical protein